MCMPFFSSLLCLKRDRRALCLGPRVRVTVGLHLREDLSFVSAFRVNICQVH